MRLTFKQSVYAIALFCIVVLMFTRCSRQVILPVFTQERVEQSELIFQKTQEENLRLKVESVLQKLLGKDTYYVSVMMFLNDEVVESESVERHPTPFSEGYSEETVQEFKRMKERALLRRPTVSSIREALSRRQGDLPGLVSVPEDGESLDALPGFPILPESILVGDDVETEEDVEVVESDFDPHEKDVRTLSKSVEENKVLINETRMTRRSPQNSISKMFVNVVVDEDHFKLLDISKDDLKATLEGVAAIDLERGDQLQLSFMPFVEKPFDWNRFYVKNRKVLEKIYGIFDKLKWVLMGLLGLAGLGWVGWLGYKWFKGYLAEQARLKEQERLRLQAEEQEREKKIIDEMDEKRGAILSLAKSKPNDFANLIMSWVEASEKEENKDG